MRDKIAQRDNKFQDVALRSLEARIIALESENRSQRIIQDILVEDNAKFRAIAKHYKRHVHIGQNPYCEEELC